MNSVILLAMLIVFTFYTRSGDPCPTSAKHARAPSFLYWFGGLALLRDYLDYRYSWRFLYPLKRDTAEALDKWPLTWIRDSQRPGHWLLSAVVCKAVAFA